jgi:signal transduction histidine kinase
MRKAVRKIVRRAVQTLARPKTVGAPPAVRAGSLAAAATASGVAAVATGADVDAALTPAGLDAVAPDLALAVQMRALAGFYPKAVHDLKGPLNNMVVTLELLADALRTTSEDEAEGAARRSRYLEALRREIARLNGSVQSLLAQTPVASETNGSFDLRRLLEEIVALLAPLATKRNVTLELQPGEPLPLVARRDQIKRALLAVALNALESAAPNGRVEVAGALADGTVTASVGCDGAAGSAAQADVFQPYCSSATGDRVTGLYVARNILETHGGEVRIEGGCVRVILPSVTPENRSD